MLQCLPVSDAVQFGQHQIVTGELKKWIFGRWTVM
jgi:hypothetical protein